MPNSEIHDVNCVVCLEIKINGRWNYYSHRKNEELPWNFAMEGEGKLPKDVSGKCRDMYREDCRNFAVFGECVKSQDTLIEADYNVSEILRKMRGDEVRVVTWFYSWGLPKTSDEKRTHFWERLKMRLLKDFIVDTYGSEGEKCRYSR